MQLTANMSLVNILDPQVITGAQAPSYWSLASYSRTAIMIAVGDVASSAAAFYAQPYQATAVAGTGAKVLTLARAYYYDASNDIAVEATVAGGKVELIANTIMVLDITVGELDVNNGFDCIGVQISAPGVNTYIQAQAVNYEMRNLVSALVD